MRLLDADPTTDAAAVTEAERRLIVKRTNLNNVHEVADFRAAVSFLQGEPGVDPDRIGIWGSSNGGAIVMAVAAVDARVKAVVSQVSAPRPVARGPVPVAANLLQDAIARVRTGQGGEVDGGFSFRSKIDAWSNQRNRDVRPGTTLDQIRPTTAVLASWPWRSIIAARARAAASSTWPMARVGTIACASRSTPRKFGFAASGCCRRRK